STTEAVGFTTVLALVVTGAVLTSLTSTSTFLGFTTGASTTLADSLVETTRVVLTAGVVSFFTVSIGFTTGVSTFLTVLVVLFSVVFTTGIAVLVSLFSALGASTFTGVVLAGSALTASFLTSSFLAGVAANEVANCLTG